jgi:hypothetical protein
VYTMSVSSRKVDLAGRCVNRLSLVGELQGRRGTRSLAHDACRSVARGVVRSVDRATCQKALSVKPCKGCLGRPVRIGMRHLSPGYAVVQQVRE